jgi:N-acetylglucosamine kinase-like BadF-type ATPase
MSTRHVVAADGGNSKTDLALATTTGTVLARVSGPGTRPQDDGLEPTVQRLAALVRQALRQADCAEDTPIEVASFFLANVDLPDEEEAMTAALTGLGIAAQVEVANDTFAVLRAGAGSGWGIAVVSGAGINAVGRHPDGRPERFLGLGSVSGDWGGGWGVGVAGIGAAVRAGDGRGAPTALRDRVADVFGMDAEAVAVAVHRGAIPERRVLDFAPVVFDAATSGDPVAAGLVHRLADEVGDYVEALVARMGLAGVAVEIVLGGGALQAANPVLMARLRHRLSQVVPLAQVGVLDVPPLAGALASALESAGASAAEIERARRALSPAAGIAVSVGTAAVAGTGPRADPAPGTGPAADPAANTGPAAGNHRRMPAANAGRCPPRSTD